MPLNEKDAYHIFKTENTRMIVTTEWILYLIVTIMEIETRLVTLQGLADNWNHSEHSFSYQPNCLYVYFSVYF